MFFSLSLVYFHWKPCGSTHLLAQTESGSLDMCTSILAIICVKSILASDTWLILKSEHRVCVFVLNIMDGLEKHCNYTVKMIVYDADK